MALEAATFISSLVATNPTSTDPVSQGDDHIRLLKTAIKATFANIAEAISTTHTELNHVYGVTSPIQTQLSSKAPLASPAFTGNISVTGTVDGRDVAADGVKLDGIAVGATANVGTITGVKAGGWWYVLAAPL